MRKHFSMLLVFLAALAITTPLYAGPAEETKAAEAKAEEPKAEEPKAEDTKAEDTKAEEPKAEEAKVEEPKTEGAKAEDPEPEKTETEPAKIESDEEALAIVKQLVDAAKNGHWSLVIAFGIMLFVYLVHRLGLIAKLGKKMVPWVAAACGILGYVAAALLVEGASIPSALSGGLMAGAAAVGLWEMLFKHFMSRPRAGGGDGS